MCVHKALLLTYAKRRDAISKVIEIPNAIEALKCFSKQGHVCLRIKKCKKANVLGPKYKEVQLRRCGLDLKAVRYLNHRPRLVLLCIHNVHVHFWRTTWGRWRLGKCWWDPTSPLAATAVRLRSKDKQLSWLQFVGSRQMWLPSWAVTAVHV